ncbi:trypco2 family protein [Streptomyces lasalocidi]
MARGSGAEDQLEPAGLRPEFVLEAETGCRVGNPARALSGNGGPRTTGAAYRWGGLTHQREGVGVELAEVIRALRDELESAVEAGAGEALRFELGPVEVEVSVAIVAGASAEVKPRFVVVSLGASGNVERTTTQRIKLTLTPREGRTGRTPMVSRHCRGAGAVSARAAGLDPQRVAEVISAGAEGEGRRCGSGYLLALGLVLTAAHVVDGAVSIRVRFNADQDGQWTARAQHAWSHPSLDIAVLHVLEASVDPPGRAPVVTRVGFGSIVRPPVECETMGFPRFKVREDPAHLGADGAPMQYRDCEHATGPATTWANRREGTLQIRVGAPGLDPDRGRSPWEGMSGAPVFSGEALVGVVGKHHRSDGARHPGRLPGRPLVRMFGRRSGRCAGRPDRPAHQT